MSATQYYHSIIDVSNEKQKSLSKKIATVSTLRLIVVLIGFTCIFVLWGNTTAIITTIIASAVIFLGLMKVHNRLFTERLKNETQSWIANDNLNRIALNLNNCNTGKEFVDPRHPYTYDLDIFGENSLFSLLDTTTTRGGSLLLAGSLQNPLNIKASVKARQEAIAELSALTPFRMLFRTTGTMARAEADNFETPTIADIPQFHVSIFRKATVVIFACSVPVLAVLTAFGVIADIYLEIVVSLSFVVAIIGSGDVGKIHSKIDKLVNAISIYHPLISTIEKQEFSSSLLQELQKELLSTGVTASQASKQLTGLLSNLDKRYNWQSFIILNALCQWDRLQLIKIERWIKNYSLFMMKWYKVLSEIDELSALATFAYNNPTYCYPNVENDDSKTVLKATQMGHPLIPANKCVCNDVAAMSDRTFKIITGANMAGKSTYLRTVGVNYILACIGSPAFATSMSFYPVTLFTGLRTTDSLHDNESYFFAELSRLQSLVEQASTKKRMLVILDEILKGTNSVDKQKGSIALVRKLVTMKVSGIIATHDLMLGNLANEFPENVDNYCFEAQITDDNLTFSYKIAPGIAKNMNAYFLMQKMGII